MLEQPGSPKTVRDMMNAFTARFGVNSRGDWTPEIRAFQEKLFGLGGRNLDLAGKVMDIDATVILSDEEVAKLEEEMAKL